MGGAGFLLGEFDYTFLLIVRWLWADFVGNCWCFVGRNIGVVGSFIGLFVGGCWLLDDGDGWGWVFVG